MWVGALRCLRGEPGFTLIELLVVIAIIAILAAILFPVFLSAKNRAQCGGCIGSMKQIGMAHTMYMDDDGGVLVPIGNVIGRPGVIIPGEAWYWPDALSQYTRSRKIHKCPTAKYFGIGMNHPQLGRWRTSDGWAKVCRYNDVAHPSKTVCFGDSGLIINYTESNPDKWREDMNVGAVIFRTPDNVGYYDAAGSATRIVNRHNGRANCVLLDGHYQSMPVSKVGFQFPLGDAQAMWDIY